MDTKIAYAPPIIKFYHKKRIGKRNPDKFSSSNLPVAFNPPNHHEPQIIYQLPGNIHIKFIRKSITPRKNGW